MRTLAEGTRALIACKSFHYYMYVHFVCISSGGNLTLTCVDRPNFGEGSAIDKQLNQNSKGKDRLVQKGSMHFVPLKSSSTFKVWSNRNLPRQHGGVEPVWIDHSTTALGRGVQFKSSPTPRPQTSPASRSESVVRSSLDGTASGTAGSRSSSPILATSPQRRWVEDRQLPRRGPVSSPVRISMGLDEKPRVGH